jgi:1,4-dihydroxy-2-naphthoate octaprenyltransferase
MRGASIILLALFICFFNISIVFANNTAQLEDDHFSQLIKKCVERF